MNTSRRDQRLLAWQVWTQDRIFSVPQRHRRLQRRLSRLLASLTCVGARRASALMDCGCLERTALPREVVVNQRQRQRRRSRSFACLGRVPGCPVVCRYDGPLSVLLGWPLQSLGVSRQAPGSSQEVDPSRQAGNRPVSGSPGHQRWTFTGQPVPGWGLCLSQVTRSPGLPTPLSNSFRGASFDLPHSLSLSRSSLPLVCRSAVAFAQRTSLGCGNRGVKK